MGTSLHLSRRAVLAGGFGLAGAATGPGSWAFAAPTDAWVVSLHMDQPYLDPSGRAWAYQPARGARSADILGDLTEEQRRWLNPFG